MSISRESRIIGIIMNPDSDQFLQSFYPEYYHLLLAIKKEHRCALFLYFYSTATN
jgi:hypothetical protein